MFQLVRHVKGGIYSAYRQKNMIEWTYLKNESKYYQSIIICLIKGTNGTHYNVIGIVRGWIFDSNLSFATPLDKIHLDWCSGATKNESICFCFCEMVQVCKG